MDKDRVEGSAANIKGKVKEGIGKVTVTPRTEAEGRADQVKGKAQNAVGGAKDKAREVLNDDSRIMLPKPSRKLGAFCFLQPRRNHIIDGLGNDVLSAVLLTALNSSWCGRAALPTFASISI
jgi:uncharacterized protein YjbJ (UPF0337 family)